MNEDFEELKLVVWKDDDGRWQWQLERAGVVIEGRRVAGVEDTFQAAYDSAKQRFLHERRKGGSDD
jgi:hypothetical protein